MANKKSSIHTLPTLVWYLACMSHKRTYIASTKLSSLKNDKPLLQLFLSARGCQRLNTECHVLESCQSV